MFQPETAGMVRELRMSELTLDRGVDGNFYRYRR